jgi:D-arabinose 1-dehydrogenase-like Zn-dependent alcohol dehydrogenase
MQAAVLPEIPSLTIAEVQVDRPGRCGVLVRTAAAGPCPSDLHVMEGWSERTPARHQP